VTRDRYAWGSNEFSNTADAQGSESQNKVCTPLSKSFFHAEHSVDGGKDAAVHVVAVAAGTKHSAAIDVKGKLYLWGCNEKSQCGNGASKLRIPENSADDPALTGRNESTIQPTFVAALSSFFVQVSSSTLRHNQKV
jgi:alpha-tubulin suppressor-like RCC1 family protein